MLKQVRRNPYQTLKKVAKYFLIFFSLLFLSISFSKNKLYSGDILELFIQYSALHEQNTLYLDDYKSALPPERQIYGKDNHIYSKYGLGYPLLAASWMKLLKLLHLDRVLLRYHTFLVPNVFLFFLSGIFFFKLLVFFSANIKLNFLATFAYLFSTFATFHGATWPATSFECSLLVISIYFLFKAFELSRPCYRTINHPYLIQSDNFKNKVTRSKSLWTDPNKFFFISGIMLAYAGLSRTFPFILVPVFLGTIFYSYFELSSWKFNRAIRYSLMPIVYFLAPCATALFFSFLINYFKTGSFSPGSYHKEEAFNTPFLLGFLGSLFWPGKSFIFFAPITVMGVFILHKTHFKSRPLFFMSVFIFLIYAVLMSKWWAWRSGPDIGQRFWIPTIPFLIVPVAFLQKKWAITLAGFLILIGCYTQYRMYFSNPEATYHAMYDEFPYSEENPEVEKILKNDFFRIIKTTFVDLAYFKHLK